MEIDCIIGKTKTSLVIVADTKMQQARLVAINETMNDFDEPTQQMILDDFLTAMESRIKFFKQLVSKV